MKGLLLLLSLSWMTIIIPGGSEGSRILGVFPFHARSHFMMFEALMKGLARKGHQVDVISAFPQKKPYPNYTDIVHFKLDVPQFVNNMSFANFNSMMTNLVDFAVKEGGDDICKGFALPEMLKFIRNPPKNPPYDVVITEQFSAHCFMALGPYLNVPTIGMSSAALYPWLNGMVANPANLAFVPNNLVNYIAPMTFWQRLYNTVNAVYSDLLYQYRTTPQNDIIKKYLGENMPGVRECERNLALVLMNTHSAINGPRPITPAVVEVGGLHVQDDGNELPRDLLKWLDDSKDGFIYFTFGSMVTIESFPVEVLEVFYKSLGKIAPMRVLIKIPDPKKLPPGLPSNFRTFVWASQFKVLKHKNIKAFITHGGLMGTQEAIHCGVPMIGIPLFADQFVNIDLYVSKKIAVKVPYQGITEEKMDKALNEILHDPIYKRTMMKVSQRFLDRPMSAMDTATWWVEYVIRHGLDNTLRSPAMDLTWWQIELFDVYATILLIVALAIFVVIALIQFIINIVFGRGPTVRSSKKNK